MKSHKPSKLIALGLALTMGLSIPAALAASSLVPASTKVTVDGKAAAVEGYNIDNGNNYYKLRDFASALDVGLTWDKATDTAAIDTGSHYKPDTTQLITGNWAPATRARIQAVIDENANQGKYVVFDFDNTSVIFDIQEALLIYQIENLQFKIDPADMEAVLETGIPDLNKSMGTSLDGKNITPATLVADITSDYEWIYANYEGFEGDKDLNYIHASNQYQDFAAKLRFMYGNLGDYFDHAVSYPWVGYLFTGMTPDEVQELAAASHQYWADYGRYAEETWTSPVELPGKTGIVSIDFITGLTFTDELKDLYATLQANGIEVYIVSASPIDTVLAANETMGYNLPEDHVYAMRNKLGEDGRYINEYNYDWGGEGKYAQTQGEGKSTIITNFIAPQYDNAGPLMVFGDSSGDWNMMTDWMESGDTESSSTVTASPAATPSGRAPTRPPSPSAILTPALSSRAATRTPANCAPARSPSCWVRPTRCWSAPPSKADISAISYTAAAGSGACGLPPGCSDQTLRFF